MADRRWVYFKAKEIGVFQPGPNGNGWRHIVDDLKSPGYQIGVFQTVLTDTAALLEIKSSTHHYRIYAKNCFRNVDGEWELTYRGHWFVPSAGGLSLTDDDSSDGSVDITITVPTNPQTPSSDREEEKTESEEFVDEEMRKRGEQEAKKRAEKAAEEAAAAEAARKKEEDRLKQEALDKDRIIKLAEKLALVEGYKKDGVTGQTHCNWFVADFARSFTGLSMVGVLIEVDNVYIKANTMYDNLVKASAAPAEPGKKAWRNVRSYIGQDSKAAIANSPDKNRAYYELIFEKAQGLANRGKLVVVSWKATGGSGHIAIIVPAEPMPTSTNWGGRKVPVVAQAGDTVSASIRFSDGFGYAKMNIETGPGPEKDEANLGVFAYDEVAEALIPEDRPEPKSQLEKVLGDQVGGFLDQVGDVIEDIFGL